MNMSQHPASAVVREGVVKPSRSFKLPSGVHPSFNGRFSPIAGLENVPVIGINSREILEKSNVILDKYGFKPIVKEDLSDPQYIASEVGDDEQSLWSTKAGAAISLVIHGEMGMKVSVEDTCISTRFGNFAEDLTVLPDGYGQTYLSNRKTGNNSISFMDVPKLRLATDIRPMRMDHSGTNDGKASMVGSRQRWIPLESPIRGIYEAFSLFQDINLGLIRDKKFPYLPVQLGGYGKEPPFRNYENLERFCKAFKQNAHTDLIRDIVHRTIDFLEDKERFLDPPKDPLLSHIVRFQSSFHDWVKGKSIYAPVTWFDIPPEVAKHRAGKLGESSLKDGVLGRLVAEGKLLTEQKLEIAVEHNELCKALVQARDIVSFKKLRDEARSRWQNLSTFSLENYGMIKELSLSPSKRGKIRGIEASRFYNLVYHQRTNLRNLLREEYVYWPKAMDEIYEHGPMRVEFTMQPRVGSIMRGFAAPSMQYQVDIEDTEEIGAIQELESWVKGGCKGLPNRTLVEDDEVIITEVSDQPYSIIVTDDIKLCRRATNKTGNVIFRVPVRYYFLANYFGIGDYTEYLNRITPGQNYYECLDTGSIKGFEENQFIDGVMLSRPSSQKFNVMKHLGEKDQVVKEEFLDFGDPDYGPHLFFDKNNILGLRKKRPRNFGQNWR